MRWSKAKATPGMEMSEPQAKEPVADSSETDEQDEQQYPGLKVVIPTTISVVLAVFLISLVSGLLAEVQASD